MTKIADPSNTMSGTRGLLSLLLVVCFSCTLLPDNSGSAQNDWTEPFPAFRIAGNLYYVGSKGLASYLVTTPEGHILINSNLEASVPLIRTSVESLGFKFTDIKILLISHAHWDHNAGSALVKQLTGAKYMVMDADVEAVESGGKTDFHYRNDAETLYKPTKVDRVLHDGVSVKLGGSELIALNAWAHQRLHNLDHENSGRVNNVQRFNRG